MKPLLAALFCISLFSFRFQEKKYVCTPCGYSCDAKQFDKPGACEECGMPLVELNSIKFKNLDFQQLCNRIKANREIILLDVRSPEEFSNTNEHESYGKFKKAININVTELEGHLAELNKYKDKEVIVYCSHSHRSPQASYFLSTHGFKNVSNVAGGVSVFKESNGAACLKDQYVVFPNTVPRYSH